MHRARDRWNWHPKLRRRWRLAPIVLACVASAGGAACWHDVDGDSRDTLALVTVDTTPPVITVSHAGFVFRSQTLFTSQATPTLTGTVTDESPVTVNALINGNLTAVPVSGGTWSIVLPPAPALTEIRMTATDAAGNETLDVVFVLRDFEAPALSLFYNMLRNEVNDQIAFQPDQTVTHYHPGSLIDLGDPTTCTPVTKFSYLLGSTTPEYVREDPGLNPIQYNLQVDDRRVGLAPESIQFRVGRRQGAMTTWVLDWTPVGAGYWSSVQSAWFPIRILSDQVPGLATTEGIYDVEFRAADLLGQTASVARCFNLTLRAPALEVAAHSGTRQTKDHAFALDSLSLAPGAPFDQLAARLLNDSATGASLIDQDVVNRTTSTIYLTVTVTPPAAVTVGKTFVLSNALTGVMQVTPSTCGPLCEVDPFGGPIHSATVAVSEPSLAFPVKVFELAGGALGTELPCLAPCPASGQAFRFALPPRASGGAPTRAFRVMTMIGQVSALWPQDAGYPASAPFADDAITWMNASGTTTTTTRLTGIVDRSVVPERSGCVKYATLGGVLRCIRTGTLVPYRALRSAALTFSSETRSRYETAATATSALRLVGAERVRSTVPENHWSTSEAALP